MESARQFTYFLLRVVVGLLFFHHGAQKLLDWFGGIPPEHGGHPAFLSQAWIGGVLELCGGLAILVGLLTRLVAFILSGMMAVAYWQFHAPGGTWPIANGGELAVLYCFIFLYMAVAGGGAISLDAMFFRKRVPVPAR